MRGGARQMLVMTNEMENFVKFKTQEGGERGRERLKYEYLGTSYGGAFSHDGIGVADLAKLRYEEMTQSRRVGGKRCQLLFIQTLKDNDKRKC